VLPLPADVLPLPADALPRPPEALDCAAPLEVGESAAEQPSDTLATSANKNSNDFEKSRADPTRPPQKRTATPNGLKD